MTPVVAISLGAEPIEAAPSGAAFPIRPTSSLFFTTAHAGVNLASAEFGGEVPGTYGLTYIYPSPQVMDYYQAKKRTLIRVPFRWERMQRSLNGPLDAIELTQLRSTLRAAHERQMQVIIDLHNYGRYQRPNDPPSHGPDNVIGTPRVPVAAYANFWEQMALALKDNPAVYGYGLMNEPHDMEDPTRWPIAAQRAINAIRSVDARPTIIVAGDNWSSARNWRTGSNETLHEKVRDPHNNLVFEAHCYFDRDNSGTYKKNYDEEGGTPDGGVEYVRPFVEWCREKGVRGFVGEYGVPDTDTRWLVTMDRFLAYLQANGMSSTYWAGGPWWGNYPMSIEPQDARETNGNGQTPPDRPQMLVMRQYPG